MFVAIVAEIVRFCEMNSAREKEKAATSGRESA
jgi:hypothetical protein